MLLFFLNDFPVLVFYTQPKAVRMWTEPYQVLGDNLLYRLIKANTEIHHLTWSIKQDIYCLWKRLTSWGVDLVL